MSSPHSASNESQAFELLAPEVRRWIWDQGWTRLHKIQEQAIFKLLQQQKDLIIAAPTAGGKTEAAFLPLISNILNEPNEGSFDILYIAPLKALINDQLGRMETLCHHTDIPVHPWHGDIAQGVKAKARTKPGGILMITPESLEALFVLRGVEIPRLFSTTRCVVIDELHAFLDTERGVQLRSQLNRIELAIGRQIRRVGLSATLKDMEMVKEYLRPGSPTTVDILENKATGAELKVQIRGYVEGSNTQKGAAKLEVSKHLYKTLKGKPNLIFAGARSEVEYYADTLRTICEKNGVPLDFVPHHASLSREHRMHVEETLKTRKTTTAICTSTLELGIDVGDINSVAQVGPPYSVSSLRQRLGRSGRRPGEASILRGYVLERKMDQNSPKLDRLHPDLIKTISMVELLIEGWCEPPAPQSLHLSTLCHQVLAVIAEKGGARASDIYNILCTTGPFRAVTKATFVTLLRDLASKDANLIEQGPDGTLLLGEKGEKLVEHYSFYAVFESAEEYRVMVRGKTIGSLPVSNVVLPEMTIIFSGKRWRVIAIHNNDHVVEVTEDHAGKPPGFEGTHHGKLHDKVAEKMREVLEDTRIPEYLNSTAAELLQNARNEYNLLQLTNRSVVRTEEKTELIATWAGTVKTTTLALLLQNQGYRCTGLQVFLEVDSPPGSPSVKTALAAIANTREVISDESLKGLETRQSQKFHCYLSPKLLFEDAKSSEVDIKAMPELARRILITQDREENSRGSTGKPGVVWKSPPGLD